MMPDSSDISVDRRSVLKATGTAVTGAAVLSGTAVASRFQFFGCSQVCSGADQELAVVWNEETESYECRTLDKHDPEQYSTRNNIEWGQAYACLEVGEDEAVVGVVSTASYTFCPNPNNCARNYYDSASAVVSALNADGCAAETISVDGTCTVYGSNGDPGGTGGGPPAGRGAPSSEGEQKGVDEEKGAETEDDGGDDEDMDDEERGFLGSLFGAF